MTIQCGFSTKPWLLRIIWAHVHCRYYSRGLTFTKLGGTQPFLEPKPTILLHFKPVFHDLHPSSKSLEENPENYNSVNFRFQKILYSNKVYTVVWSMHPNKNRIVIIIKNVLKKERVTK